MLENDISNLWEWEKKDLDEVGWSQKDKSAIDLWDKACIKVDAHYQLPIPCKNCAEPLLNNLCRSKIASSVNCWKDKKYDIYEKDDLKIKKLLSCCYAEIVPLDQVFSAKCTWYLPHHAVTTEKSPID